MTPAWLTLALIACVKQPALPGHDQLNAAPRLPSPEAGTYARTQATPPDPVIAKLVRGRRWDASLGGAASGLALRAVAGAGGLQPWEVREATWRAGYPYPVAEVRGWSTPAAAAPPESLLTWLTETVSADDDIGLVRARGERGEAWVALRARPRVALGVQPREVERGDQVTLPATAGASYTVVDAEGRIVHGALDIEQYFTLDVLGEWLFQVADDDGTAAQFPIYVGMAPPDVPLLDHVETGDAADPAQRARQLLTEVRGAYGSGPWQTDLLLERAARSLLAGHQATTATIARESGFDPERTWRLECRARTLHSCVDKLLWTPRSRQGLLANTRYLGLAAQNGQSDVHVVALVAAELPDSR